MSGPDAELESLMARRMAEMRKNVAREAAVEAKQPDGSGDSQKPARSARDILVARLGHRGLEVLQNAEAQWPREMAIVVSKLGELVESGELRDMISGGDLMELLRAIGIHVRLQTRISVESDGKLVSLSDKLGAARARPDDVG